MEETYVGNEHITLRRQLYTQNVLDKVYEREPKPHYTVPETIKTKCSNAPRFIARQLLSYLPIVGFLRTYQWRQWILADIISGLSVGFIHLPQSLGYGLLAGLTPVYGLYSTFFPVLIYIFFGTSPHISMGTNAVISLLISSLVTRELATYKGSLAGNMTLTLDDEVKYKAGVAAGSTFIAGLILMGMGFLRLGFLTNFLSKSFIGGFTFAAAVHITTSQIVKLLNLPLKTRGGYGKLVYTYIDIFTVIGKTNPGDVIVGFICMGVLLGINLGINQRFKAKMKVPIPAELLVVIVSTLISHYTELNKNFRIAIVGSVPAGMPTPTLPAFDSLGPIASDSFVIAILVFALTIALAKLTAKLQEITIDDNQELVAYGICNIIGCFFLNMPASSSPPRTMMLNSLGSKSSLNGVSTALFILLVLLVLGQLFVSLPIAMLAAMIIVAMRDLLLQVRNLPSLWVINKNDFFIWFVTAVVSIFGDLDLGLLAGVVISMITVLAVSQLAKGRLLGKAEHEDVIVELDRSGINPYPGVKIFRFEAAVYFASQERFKSQIYRLVSNPSTLPRKTLTAEVEVICEPDFTADILTVQDKVNDLDKTDSSDIMNQANGLDKTGSTVHLVHVNGLNKTDLPAQLNVNGLDNPGFQAQLNVNGLDKPRYSISYHQSVNQEKAGPDTLRYLILDCSALTYIDASGLDMLELVVTQFGRAGVEVWLACVPRVTLATLARAGLVDKVGADNVFYTVIDALKRVQLAEEAYVGVKL